MHNNYIISRGKRELNNNNYCSSDENKQKYYDKIIIYIKYNVHR